MRVLMFLFVGTALFQGALAVNELGSLDTARSRHPAVFVPCNVLEYTVGSEHGYVFSGESAQRFGTAMSDSKLYREATLDARRNLYKFLTKGDKSKTVEMSGARQLYQYTEGEMRRVILFVPKKNVSVRVFVPQPIPVKKPDTEVAKKIPPVQLENKPESETPQHPANGVVPSPVPAVARQPVNVVIAPQPPTGIAAGEETASTSRVDRLAVCLKQMEEKPGDCTIMVEVARLYAERGNFPKASSIYAKIVDCVVADTEIDKMIAVELLVEAAEFEKENGNAELALKYYRTLVRCDSMRGWKLKGPVAEANRNISKLLLKTF